MKQKKILITIIGVIAVVGIGILTYRVTCNRPLSQEKQQQLTHDLSRPFQATANIKLDEMVIIADLNKTAPNQFTMKIAQPQTLKDLSFSYNGSDITVSYKGMSAVLSDDSFVAKTLAGIVMRSINSATESTGLHISEQDHVLVIEGSNEDGNFTMQIDKQSGSILTLNVPQLKLECNFPQFFFTDDTTSSIETVSNAKQTE